MKPTSGIVRWIHRPDSGLRGLLAINETLYAVWPHLNAGRIVGWHLAKQDGKAYDVLTAGIVYPECDCGDYLYRRHGRDVNGCKHVAALRAALAQIGVTL